MDTTDAASLPLAQLHPVLAARLSGWARHATTGDTSARRAAVAITIYEKSGRAHFLMIKRAASYSNPGQWALPGGRMEAGETITDTAMRELQEETGLIAQPEDVLGFLDDFTTRRGIVITPVVVLLHGPQAPRRSPVEVASLHPIALARLAAAGVPRWKRTAGYRDLLQMPLRHDMLVHAPTGAILFQFAEVALRCRAVRVSGLAEPEFTAH